MKHRRPPDASDDEQPSPASGRVSPTDSSGKDGGAATRPSEKRKRQLTRNACIKCRLAKAKCNGKHPTCTRCKASGSKCVYDVQSEGITKMQSLQQRLDLKTSELDLKTVDHDRLMMIVSRLQHGTDQQASEVLARLRLGESIEHILDGLDTQLREALTVPTAPNQSWPPLHHSDSNPFQEFDSSRHGRSFSQHDPAFSDGSLSYPSPLESNPTFSRSCGSIVRGMSLDDSAYRHLPQISFGGTTWCDQVLRDDQSATLTRRGSLSAIANQGAAPAALRRRPPIHEGLWPMGVNFASASPSSDDR